jgi:hypothetical protein
MTNAQSQKDLIVLTADKNMEFAVKGVLTRYRSLGIREIAADFRVHPENDPGCLIRGHDFLKPFSNQYQHALILLDREGSGGERETRETLETRIEGNLAQAAWGDRAAAIVIDPELEMWIWSDSPHVEFILGWHGKELDLRSWLLSRRYLDEGNIKPSRPKEALEDALRTARKPRSSSLYFQLAEKVSLERCVDQSFVKLKNTLQKWFPID